MSQAKRRLMRRPAVEEATGLCRSEIYDRMRAGTFPKTVRLGTQSVAWVEEEVMQWIDARVAERDQVAA